jgi:hypothetical protein
MGQDGDGYGVPRLRPDSYRRVGDFAEQVTRHGSTLLPLHKWCKTANYSQTEKPVSMNASLPVRHQLSENGPLKNGPPSQEKSRAKPDHFRPFSPGLARRVGRYLGAGGPDPHPIEGAVHEHC